MFLTPADVKVMTGAKQLKTQRLWCTNNGIEYRTGKDGQLKILAQHIEDVFNPCVKKGKVIKAPDFSVLEA